MKTFPIFISLAMLAVLSSSCSRQLSSLNYTTQLKTITSLENKRVMVQAQNVYPSTKIENPAVVASNPGIVCPEDSKLSTPILKKETKTHNLLKNEVNAVRYLVIKQVSDLTFSHKYISERGYPQINKAGLIFIAAAILGYFLHLILIACIIIGVIGLIVLLSPLFRKRY